MPNMVWPPYGTRCSAERCAAIQQVRPDLGSVVPPTVPPSCWQGEAGIRRAAGALVPMREELDLRNAAPDALLAAITPTVLAWFGVTPTVYTL